MTFEDRLSVTAKVQTREWHPREPSRSLADGLAWSIGHGWCGARPGEATADDVPQAVREELNWFRERLVPGCGRDVPPAPVRTGHSTTDDQDG